MAQRPCYRPLTKYVGVKTVDSAPFEWHGGFAFSQKQKNVVALHEAIHRIDPGAKILEISSKSLQPLGVSLSAFNLMLDHLYLTALTQNPKLADQLMEFDAFTDIEFNPNRQINCQATAAALYVSLRRQGKLEEAMSRREP